MDNLSVLNADGAEPDVDKCHICLSPFTEQTVASLNSCQHVFCLQCILQWSKVNITLSHNHIYSPSSKYNVFNVVQMLTETVKNTLIFIHKHNSTSIRIMCKPIERKQKIIRSILT